LGDVQGIFMMKGADLRIPAGSIRVRLAEDGTPTADPVMPLPRTDVWPHWMAEALDAAIRAAPVAKSLTAEVSLPTSDERLADLLERELRASMRAMTTATWKSPREWCNSGPLTAPPPREAL
jgi:hypothetical protein